MQPSTLDTSRWLKPAAVAAWLVASWAWLRSDALLRDGDEEGHVGAAELFRADLLQGDVAGFVERLWVGPMGEYPQMFSAMVGGWWWLTGLGDPAHPVVRSICLVSLPVAALATGRIAARLHGGERARRVDAWVTLMVLTVPLANGLTRHFMPESLVMAVTAVAVLSALRWADYPSLGRSIQLGAVLGVGLMTKQTFFLAAALPVAWAVRERLTSRPGMLAAVAAVATAIAAPWLAVNLGPQLAYAGASVAGHGSSVGLDHLAFYPRSVLWVGLGPVLTAAAVWAFVRGRDKPGFAVAAIWLLGGLLVLMVIPKKYPRLMAPLLPAAVLLMAGAWRPGGRVWVGVASAAAAWTVWLSVDRVAIHRRSPGVDPGCPQEWIRPPGDSDVGLSRAAEALAKLGPGDVRVVADPAIPCAVQTTHDWSNHLGPLLRRRGQDRTVHRDAEQPHRFVLEWGERGQGTEVPELNQSFTIRDRLGP